MIFVLKKKALVLVWFKGLANVNVIMLECAVDPSLACYTQQAGAPHAHVHRSTLSTMQGLNVEVSITNTTRSIVSNLRPIK